MKELDLDGVKSGGEINFGEYEFNSLESLDISNSFLTSLKNFPVLPNLKRVGKVDELFQFKPCFFFSLSFPTTDYQKDLKSLQFVTT